MADSPSLIMEDGFNPSREREIETIFSLGNGFIGTRNSLEEHHEISDVGTYIAGFYEKLPDDDYNELIKVPDWTKIEIFVEDNKLDLFNQNMIEHRRYLDLDHGVYIRDWLNLDEIGRLTNIRIMKFVSLSNKHEVCKSLTIKPENYSGKIKVRFAIDGSQINYGDLSPEIARKNGYIALSMNTEGSNKIVVISQTSEFIMNEDKIPQADFFKKNISYNRDYQNKIIYEEWEWIAQIDESSNINSLLSIYTNANGMDPKETSHKHIKNLNKDFFKKAYKQHEEKWKKRWNESKIIIEGDKIAQKWVNFALYHLIISGEYSGVFSSIPARSLSGQAYKGHVFWDTTMYLLPFFTLTKPEIAKDLLIYRYNTLPGAREKAKNEGYKGAFYAWESTDSGLEMTPSFGMLPNGEVVKILTGKYQKHISADIAYGVWQYWQVTLDEGFLVDYGAEIIFETARFCIGLLVKENDGLLHTHDIMGPDEYHKSVNDNAYTNFLIQHNLDIAVKISDFLNEYDASKYEKLKKKINLGDSEINFWKEAKDNIYTDYDPKTKIFEQFKDYSNLEFIDVRDYEPRTAPLDIILGSEKIEASQIIKQADVLMFLFLLGNKFPIDITRANYEYYNPRTAHGSSLSPSIYSIIAARSGKSNEAYKYFAQNATVDLNDNMGNAAGGIHIASLGGVWMSVVMGFAGLYIYDDGLLFDPHLPAQWHKIEFSILWRKQKINIEITKTNVTIKVDGFINVPVSIGFENWKNLVPDTIYTAIKEDKWRWK